MCNWNLNLCYSLNPWYLHTILLFWLLFLAVLLAAYYFQDAVDFNDILEFFWSLHLIPNGPSFFQGLTIVTHVLREGGKFIAKIFRGKDTSLLYCQVNQMLVKTSNIRNLFLEIWSAVYDQNYTWCSRAKLCNPLSIQFSLLVKY